MIFEGLKKRDGLITMGLAAVYFLWITLVVGLRGDHLLFLALVLGLFFASRQSRKVVMALIFFAIYWIVYDSMRVYPNFEFSGVHVREPYELEKAWFGFQYRGQTVTANEFFAANTNPVLDILSGVFYLCWVPVPLMFALWLFFKDKRLLLDFSLVFLLTNIFGFMLYYAYPAAPPWYVELHGFQVNFNTAGNEAGLANFDRLLGISLFHGMYAKNANVFAAIPSLHAAYPLVTLYFGIKKKLRLASWAFLITLAGIWFSAVYSRHHYIIDVLLGCLCAVATILIYEKIILKTRVNEWLNRYSELIK